MMRHAENTKPAAVTAGSDNTTDERDASITRELDAEAMHQRPLYGPPSFRAAVRLWQRFTDQRPPFAAIRLQLATNGPALVRDAIELLGSNGNLAEQTFFEVCARWHREDQNADRRRQG